MGTMNQNMTKRVMIALMLAMAAVTAQIGPSDVVTLFPLSTKASTKAMTTTTTTTARSPDCPDTTGLWVGMFFFLLTTVAFSVFVLRKKCRRIRSGPIVGYENLGANMAEEMV